MSGYRLEPVREQRERDERAKKSELADAVGAIGAADALVGEMSRRVAQLREALRHAAPAPTAALIVATERYRTRLRSQLEHALLDELRAKESRDGVATSADRARERLAIARGARQVIESHFSRWRDEQRKLAERRED